MGIIARFHFPSPWCTGFRQRARIRDYERLTRFLTKFKFAGPAPFSRFYASVSLFIRIWMESSSNNKVKGVTNPIGNRHTEEQCPLWHCPAVWPSCRRVWIQQYDRPEIVCGLICPVIRSLKQLPVNSCDKNTRNFLQFPESPAKAG